MNAELSQFKNDTVDQNDPWNGFKKEEAPSFLIVGPESIEQKELSSLFLANAAPIPNLSSYEDAVKRVASTVWNPPLVLICALIGKDDAGLDRVLALGQSHPFLQILIYAEPKDSSQCVLLMQKGATGILVKGSPYELQVEQLKRARVTAGNLWRADFDRRTRQGSWH